MSNVIREAIKELREYQDKIDQTIKAVEELVGESAHDQDESLGKDKPDRQKENLKQYQYTVSRVRIAESITALGMPSTVAKIRKDLATRFHVKARTEDIEALLTNNPEMFESVAGNRWLVIRRPDDSTDED